MYLYKMEFYFFSFSIRKVCINIIFTILLVYVNHWCYICLSQELVHDLKKVYV